MSSFRWKLDTNSVLVIPYDKKLKLCLSLNYLLGGCCQGAMPKSGYPPLTKSSYHEKNKNLSFLRLAQFYERI